MDQRVQAVTAQMRAALERKYSLTGLARQVNLSVSRLSLLFKIETGLAPLQYLRKLRLEKSGELLAGTFLTVREVRARTGFADESHFLRDFKRAFGLTPSQYRALHQQAENVRPGKSASKQ